MGVTKNESSWDWLKRPHVGLPRDLDQTNRTAVINWLKSLGEINSEVFVWQRDEGKTASIQTPQVNKD